MGERKVINKYIPSDFDPSLVPRGKKLSAKDGTVPVRMMLPFSMQCETCQTFLYRGRKYNSRKEPMGGPDGKYLGITRFRFYIKCNHCSRPISFLTDPKNADYEVESGATRNYEIHRDRAAEEVADAQESEHAAKMDPMKALEDRVLDSQREMADLDNLEEIKAMNARHVQLMKNRDGDLVVPRDGGGGGGGGGGDDDDDHADDGTSNNNDSNKKALVELTAEDEALIKSIKFGRQRRSDNDHDHDEGKIRRLDESDEAQLEAKRRAELAAFEKGQTHSLPRQEQKNSAAAAAADDDSRVPLPVRIIKRKAKVEAEEGSTPPPHKKADLTSLLGGYGSDDSSSD